MRRHLLIALAGLVSVLPLSGVTAPASAQAPTGSVGIRILDAPTNRVDDPRARLYIVDHMAPAATISRRVEVSNGTGKEQAVQLYAASAGLTDGAFTFGEGRAENELTRWTRVEPSTLPLAPGAKGTAMVTVAVSPKASAGERYGVVWAELNAAPPAGGGIGATNRVGVRMYLSVGPGASLPAASTSRPSRASGRRTAARPSPPPSATRGVGPST